MKKCSLIYLFGGTSNERRVSVASAQNVTRTLAPRLLYFIAPDARVYEVSASELLAHQRPYETDFQPQSEARFASIADALDAPDAVAHAYLLCFHGGTGEDGTIQRELESRNLPFTGSGSEASARAMDKRAAKEVARTAGIPIAPDLVIPAAGIPESARSIEKMFSQHGSLVVKPAGGGSTLGVYFIRTTSDIQKCAADLMAGAAEDYLIEKLLEGRELTVGVVDMNGELLALPPSEVLLEKGREFDYEGKYLGKGVQEITPADISDELRTNAQELALRVHTALGCEGYSRTDIIVTESDLYFLETNTLPGLSGASFIPQQLAAAKIPMKEFIVAQLELGMRRAGGGSLDQ